MKRETVDEYEAVRRKAMRRAVAADMLWVPPLGICGWAFGQGLQHDLPALSVLMVVAALCLAASFLMGRS